MEGKESLQVENAKNGSKFGHDRSKTIKYLASGLIVLGLVLTVGIIIWKNRNPSGRQGNPDEDGGGVRKSSSLISATLGEYLNAFEKSKKELDQALSDLRDQYTVAWNLLNSYDEGGFKFDSNTIYELENLENPVSDPVYKRRFPFLHASISGLFFLILKKGLYMRAKYISEKNITDCREIFGENSHENQIKSFFSNLPAITCYYERIAHRYIGSKFSSDIQDYRNFQHIVIEYCDSVKEGKEFDDSALEDVSKCFIDVDQVKALKSYVNDLTSMVSAILERKDEIPSYSLLIYRLDCRLEIYSNLLKRLNLD